MNKSFFLFSFVLSCCQAGFFLLSSTSAAIIQVPSDTSSIQGAVSLATSGDTILVADGTYYENILVRGKALTLASYFILDNNSNHITNTIIDGSQPIHPDSGTVIFFTAGPTENSLVCGFTITGGTGTFVVPGIVRSGGGLIIENSGCEVRNNIIQNNSILVAGTVNSYGGGIATYNETGVVIIRNNQIFKNQIECQSGGGGAIALYSMEEVLVENNLIKNNVFSASEFAPGGGLYLNGDETFNGPMIVRGNVIAHNETHTTSPTEVSGGGGMYISNPHTILRNNYICNNIASGAVYPRLSSGGGINCGNISNFHLVLENNIISRNLSHLGGGIALWGTGELSALNNTVVENTITHEGGGMIIWHDVRVFLLNNILWNNTGSGQIMNWSSIAGQYYYNDIQGGWPGTGNINFDPQFTDTLFHLLPSSVCIGTGRANISLVSTTYLAPPFDLEGNPRPDPIDTLVDIGVYETPYPARAQLISSSINQGSGYINPGQDSVRILLQIIDPHQQGVNITASMSNLQGAVWDETTLYDDGQHGDGDPGDDLFGAILPPVIMEEAFRCAYWLVNSTFQDTLGYQGEQQITSIGPLVCENYQILTQNGNRLQLELVLRNQGLQTTATEVRAELIPKDSSVVQIINNNESFGDIPAGGTAVNSNAYIIDTIENPRILSFAVRISMGGYPYWVQEGLVVGIEPVPRQLPTEFVLYQNYPNPFNPTTVISWQLAVGNLVKLSLYDLSGREITVLMNEEQPAGHHQIEFDASGLASGVYLYRLSAGNFVESKKMLLLK